MSELVITMFRRYEFTYTNWKGITKTRKAQFYRVTYGSTEYHPEPQFLIHGFDLDKKDTRTYALKDIRDIKYLNEPEGSVEWI